MNHVVNRQKMGVICQINLKIILCIVIAFNLSLNILAQAPGFLGKKFLIGFEAPMIVTGISISGETEDYNYYTTDESGDLVPINRDYSNLAYKVKPTLLVEYVLDRRSSLQIFGRFFGSNTNVEGFYSDSATVYNYYHPSDRAKTRTIAAGIKYKKFLSGGLNPVGKYLGYGLEYASSKFNIEETPFYAYGFTKPLYPKISRTNTIVPTFSIGSQTPVTDDLLVNFGIEFGLPLVMTSKTPELITADTWAKENSKLNFRYSYLLNITIGVLFLP